MTRRDRPYVMPAVPPTRRAPRATWGHVRRTLILACLVSWCFTAGIILLAAVLFWQAGHLQVVLR